MRKASLLFSVAAVTTLALACGGDDDAPPGEAAECPGAAEKRFPAGSPDGHPDPFGAKAAGQARAGKVTSPAMVKQAANARHAVRPGDFVLANDKLVAYVEDKGESDGYNPFGGELLAIEPVGDDGRPRGISQYGETLMAFSRQAVAPDSVTVLADGADGKAAIVRVSGVLKNVPFLDTFKPLLPAEYGYPAALDYVLEPGSERLLLRLSLQSVNAEEPSFKGKQMVGFFQSARSATFTESEGFGPARGASPFVGFDAGESSFAIRMVGSTIDAGLAVSGFQYFTANGLAVPACKEKVVDYMEIVPAVGGIDALREAIRRVDKAEAWRETRGKLTDAAGAPIAGGQIHALGEGGKYLTRATTAADGSFSMHLPAAGASLQATAQGYAVSSPLAASAGASDLALKLPQGGALKIVAKEAGTNAALPVRVQVIPSTAVAAPPPSFGVETEVGGRLWQAYATTGELTLPVPAGQHRVIVTRGYEYELFDQTFTVDAGKTVDVTPTLAHSVDSTGVMCADFHIHSNYSADSADTPIEKVKSAIADGLDIPVSSEHEYIIDFQPLIAELGLTKWAFGFPSEELTTFTFGHFGVVPIYPRPEKQNRGAVPWIGKKASEIFKSVNELPEKPVVIVNHPSGGGFTAYFSSTSFDATKGAGSGDNWSDDFGAIEVFNDSSYDQNRDKSVAHWYAMLNAGKTVWAVGNSDSHHIRTSPVGYPRTCIRFGHDDPTKLTAEIVRDGLRAGQATISGGLYMTVEGPGGAAPGATASAGAYKVVVQAPAWLTAKDVEMIVDGASVETKELGAPVGAGPGKRWELTFNVAAQRSAPRHYVVFHARSDSELAPLHPGRKAFAASNPIFFN